MAEDNKGFHNGYFHNKIENSLSSVVMNNFSNMKPIYSTDEREMCGVIEYNNKKYLLDLHDKDRIINFNKNFVYINENDTYPSYCYNYKRFSYLDFVFGYNSGSVCYEFKNNNQFDLRRSNVKIYHSYHANIDAKYDIIEYIPGHYMTVGQDANIMKNPIWKIKENGMEYLLMYCEKDTICKLCPNSYKKILDYENTYNNKKKLTWYKHQNGYILCSSSLYIHQVITGCYGNGKGTKNVSVDHIDQDPLNNTFENLRVATRKEQEENSKGIKTGTKRERKSNAKCLPDGIIQNMLRKYVVYYQEWLDKEHTKQREYFKVEKHPKLDKPWITTKSNNVSITDKLIAANKVVDDLEHDIYPVKEDLILPKYVSLINSKGKPHLVYEKRKDDKRFNFKMVLPESYDLHEQVSIMKVKLREKYGFSVLDNDTIFNYVYDVKIDNSNKYINSITFDIARHYNIQNTLIFETTKTEAEAVSEVEKWLSAKITREYYDDISDKVSKNDNNCYKFDYDFETCKTLNWNKGAFLGGGKFLELIKHISNTGHVELICGS